MEIVLRIGELMHRHAGDVALATLIWVAVLLFYRLVRGSAGHAGLLLGASVMLWVHAGLMSFASVVALLSGYPGFASLQALVAAAYVGLALLFLALRGAAKGHAPGLTARGARGTVSSDITLEDVMDLLALLFVLAHYIGRAAFVVALVIIVSRMFPQYEVLKPKVLNYLGKFVFLGFGFLVPFHAFVLVMQPGFDPVLSLVVDALMIWQFKRYW